MSVSLDDSNTFPSMNNTDFFYTEQTMREREKKESTIKKLLSLSLFVCVLPTRDTWCIIYISTTKTMTKTMMTLARATMLVLLLTPTFFLPARAEEGEKR